METKRFSGENPNSLFAKLQNLSGGPGKSGTPAWRGVYSCASLPNRAKWKRLAGVAMNSMAQHAVPNGIGHNELARDEFTAQSIRS